MVLVTFGCSEPGSGTDPAEPPSRAAPATNAERGSARRTRPRRPGKRLFPGPTRARRARVTGVTDGDTVTLAGVGRTRLIGADTPEVFGGRECFGEAASEYTKRVLETGGRVLYRIGTEPRDRYGRALAYVWLRDGRMFNGLLVQRGYALPLAIAPNVEYAGRFRTAARRARVAGVGLWGVRGCARDAAGSRRNGGRRGGGSSRGGGSGGGESSAGDRDCGDFSSQVEAQRYFDRRGGGPGRNVDHLDSDDDGKVCESLPQP